MTHWRLADQTEVDIVNFLDDHSRLAVASAVMATATAPKVLQAFREAGARWGFPAALLTDIQAWYRPSGAWIDRPAARGSGGPAPVHFRSLTDRSAQRLLAC